VVYIFWVRKTVNVIRAVQLECKRCRQLEIIDHDLFVLSQLFSNCAGNRVTRVKQLSRRTFAYKDNQYCQRNNETQPGKKQKPALPNLSGDSHSGDHGKIPASKCPMGIESILVGKQPHNTKRQYDTGGDHQVKLSVLGYRRKPSQPEPQSPHDKDEKAHTIRMNNGGDTEKTCTSGNSRPLG